MKTVQRIRELKKIEEDVLESAIQNMNGVKVLDYTLRVVKAKGRSYLQARKGRKEVICVGRVFKLVEIEKIILEKRKNKTSL